MACDTSLLRMMPFLHTDVCHSCAVLSGVPHIEALLHQAKLLMEEPAPAKDIRPRFKRIEKVLVQAEEMAAK